MNHDWKFCRCTDCQGIQQDVDQARQEGAEFMREKILTLARQFGVPAMAITYLKGVAGPERRFK